MGARTEYMSLKFLCNNLEISDNLLNFAHEFHVLLRVSARYDGAQQQCVHAFKFSGMTI